MRNILASTAVVVGVALGTVQAVRADDPQPAGPHYTPLTFEAAREQTFAWAAAAAQTEEPPPAVQQIWETAEEGIPARGVQELVMKSFAAVDTATATLMARLDPRQMPFGFPETESLTDAGDPFYRTNLALHVARVLTDARMYDEALALFDKVDLNQAIDPATALFYRSVCEHQLLMKEEGLATLSTLLDSTDPVPESYATVARLMRAELELLESDSLDEVARLMRDVERRLDLARGGQRVQKKEDEIAAKLDEMIKKLEQQMSQSSSSGGGSNGGQNQSSNPLDDSVVKGTTAPGEVDSKDVRREGDWGDLPPRERERAKNEIERAFPANYSRLINEYFLKRARSDRPSGE